MPSGTSTREAEILNYLKNTPLPLPEGDPNILMNAGFLDKIRNFFISNEDSTEMYVFVGEFAVFLPTLYEVLAGEIKSVPLPGGGYKNSITAASVSLVIEEMNNFLEGYGCRISTEDNYQSYLFECGVDGSSFSAESPLFANLYAIAPIQESLRASIGAGVIKTAYLGTKQAVQLYLGGSPLIR